MSEDLGSKFTKIINKSRDEYVKELEAKIKQQAAVIDECKQQLEMAINATDIRSVSTPHTQSNLIYRISCVKGFVNKALSKLDELIGGK